VREAKRVRFRTFVAHVRYAMTGAPEPANTHPFEPDDRLLAHNGMVEDPDALHLFLLERAAGGGNGAAALDQAHGGRIRAVAEELEGRAASAQRA